MFVPGILFYIYYKAPPVLSLAFVSASSFQRGRSEFGFGGNPHPNIDALATEVQQSGMLHAANGIENTVRHDT